MKTKMPKISQELKDAVTTYLLAQAWVETVKPIVKSYQAQVLADAQIVYSDEFEAQGLVGVITDWEDLFLMDGRQSDEFFATLDAARDAAGFVGYQPGYCPLSVAEYEVIDAARALIDASTYFTNVTADMATRDVSIFKEFTAKAVAFVLAACPEITTASVLATVKP